MREVLCCGLLKSQLLDQCSRSVEKRVGWLEWDTVRPTHATTRKVVRRTDV